MPYVNAAVEPVVSECLIDSDCPSRQTCTDTRTCANPCETRNPCAAGQTCGVEDTVPTRTVTCMCPEGFFVDASGKCNQGGNKGLFCLMPAV